jgi:hypothetical protein
MNIAQGIAGLSADMDKVARVKAEIPVKVRHISPA